MHSMILKAKILRGETATRTVLFFCTQYIDDDDGGAKDVPRGEEVSLCSCE